MRARREKETGASCAEEKEEEEREGSILDTHRGRRLACVRVCVCAVHSAAMDVPAMKVGVIREEGGGGSCLLHVGDIYVSLAGM